MAMNLKVVLSGGGEDDSSSVSLPHFAAPFAFNTQGRALVVDQDAVSEVAAGVLNILSCPKGFRADLPEFGLTDPTFSTVPFDPGPVARAISDWEKRARVEISVQPATDAAVSTQTVTVNVDIYRGN